ncbi:MAG: hypothetical protein QXL02_03020 [Candidatus Anstonellales archaeon]
MLLRNIKLYSRIIIDLDICLSKLKDYINLLGAGDMQAAELHRNIRKGLLLGLVGY